MTLMRTVARPAMKVILPLLLVLIAGLGVTHLLIRTAPYGVSIQGDAGSYLNMAAGFQAGDGRGNNGHYPPGYPLLIAALGLAGIDLREAGRLINVTAFGSTLLAAGFWLRRHARSRIVTCMATSMLAVSIPLNHYASIMHSETLFTLFLLLALICSGESTRARNMKEGRLWWVSTSIFASLASVTRYAGVTVVAALVLAILLQRRAPLVDKLKSGILFGAVSSIPLAAVLAYNGMQGRMLGGHRIRPTGEQDWAIPRFESWMQALNAPDWIPLLLALVAFALVVAGGWMAYDRCTSSRSASSLDWTPVVPFLVFASVYGVMVLTVAPMVTVGSKVRYLAMLHVPVFLSVAILVDRLLGMKTAGLRAAAAKWTAVSVMAAGGFTDAVLSARANLSVTADVMESGRPGAYNNVRWETSETLNYVRANPPGTRIFSNHPTAFFLIDPFAPMATSASGRFERLRRQVEQEAGGAAIVWFAEYPSRYAYGSAELSEMPGVEKVVTLSDGAVFFYRPAGR